MSTAPAPVQLPERQQPSWGRLLWGIALVGAGVLWLLDVGGVVDVTFPRVVGLALIVVGIATPFVPAREHGGVIALGIVLVVLALLSVLIGPAANLTVLRSGAGDVTLAPAAAGQVRETYEHGAGSVTVDLRDIAFPVGATATAVRLGAGDLTVRVPEDVTVQIDANAGMGEVVIDGQERAGVAPSFTGELAGTSPSRVLSLDLSVGLGRIEVTR